MICLIGFITSIFYDLGRVHVKNIYLMYVITFYVFGNTNVWQNNVNYEPSPTGNYILEYIRSI